MRTAPLAVLVATVAILAVVRGNHREQSVGRAAEVHLVASAPSAKVASLPPVIAPGDAAVAPGSPRMLHGDPHHTHRAHGHLPSAPHIAWSLVLDGPVEGQAVVSPDDGTVYVATLGGTLWALDRQGHPRFRTELGGRAYGTPVVAPDGTIYVGCDGGAFFAIDPSGRIVWRLETDGDADSGAVLTDDGLIVFAAGSRVYGARSGGVVAFRFRARGKVFSAPALVGTGEHQEIVFGSQDNHVYDLGTDGALLWATDLGHDVDSSPVVGDDGSVTVGTDGDTVVRLSRSGEVVWRTAVEGMVRGSLSVARDGAILAGVYGPSPRVVRLTAANGETLGAFPVRGNGSRETGVHGAPLEDDDGALAFGGQDGFVRVVGSDGQQRWAYDARSDVDAPLTLFADGSLLAETYAGSIINFAP